MVFKRHGDIWQLPVCVTAAPTPSFSCHPPCECFALLNVVRMELILWILICTTDHTSVLVVVFMKAFLSLSRQYEKTWQPLTRQIFGSNVWKTHPFDCAVLSLSRLTGHQHSWRWLRQYQTLHLRRCCFPGYIDSLCSGSMPTGIWSVSCNHP